MIHALCWGLLGSCAIGAGGIALVHGLARLIPNAGPRVRHYCWSAVLLSTALSPIFCVAAGIVSENDIRISPAPAVPAAIARVHFASRSIAVLPSPRVAAILPQRTGTAPSWFAIVALVWIVISAARLAQLGGALRRLRKIKRDSRELPTLPQSRPRRARVYVSPEISSPITAGYFHPAILLPHDLVAGTSDADLECIVLHEFAHIRRHDDWGMLLERVIGAVLWFNPAISYVARRLALERELACDREVVARTGSPRRYAELLWKLTQNELGAQTTLAPGVAPPRSQIGVRIQSLLQPHDNRTSPAARFFAAASATALCTSLILLALFITPVLARQNLSRTGITTVVLRNGRTLVLGGRMSDGSFVRAAQEIDSRTGAVAVRATMNLARAKATATLLADGTVLVTGGWTREGVTAQAEIYRPNERAFSPVGEMTYPRADHSATLLADGRVLLVGGRSAAARFIATPEFYAPATQQFVRAAADGDQRIGLATRLLANGSVLVWGGVSPRGRAMHCAIAFDPLRQRFYDVGFTNPLVDAN